VNFPSYGPMDFSVVEGLKCVHSRISVRVQKLTVKHVPQWKNWATFCLVSTWMGDRSRASIAGGFFMHSWSLKRASWQFFSCLLYLPAQTRYHSPLYFPSPFTSFVFKRNAIYVYSQKLATLRISTLKMLETWISKTSVTFPPSTRCNNPRIEISRISFCCIKYWVYYKCVISFITRRK
jgi:hypothetical protein